MDTYRLARSLTNWLFVAFIVGMITGIGITTFVVHTNQQEICAS